MRNMETAPRDGTRVMVKFAVLQYREASGEWARVGECWREAWYDGVRWQPWSGSKKTRSTAAVIDHRKWVLGWMPVEVLEEGE